MAKPSGTIQAPLTKEDLEYAKMLLSWSHSLDERQTRLEDYQEVYWEKRVSN